MADDAATTTTPTPDTTPAPDWRSGLTGDYAPLAGDKTLANVKGKDWTEAGPALAKMVVEGQKLIGAKAIKFPGKESTPEEVSAFRNAAGVPDAPEKYTVTRPQVAALMGWDDAMESDFLKLMHGHHASPQLVQSIIDWEGRRVAAEHDAMHAERQALESDLRAKWGANYAANLGMATRAVKEYGGEELLEALTRAKVHNHPALVAAFHKIGADLIEHGAMKADAPAGLDSEAARARIKEIRADKKHPFNNQFNDGHMKALDEMMALERIARGEG